VSCAEPDEHNVLFDGTFADVRRDAQRRGSAPLGSLIAQLFRRRNDAGLHTAGDSRLRTADVRWSVRVIGCDDAAAVADC